MKVVVWMGWWRAGGRGRGEGYAGRSAAAGVGEQRAERELRVV